MRGIQEFFSVEELQTRQIFSVEESLWRVIIMIVMNATLMFNKFLPKRSQFESYLRIREQGADEHDLKLARVMLGLTLEDIDGFEAEAAEKELAAKYAEASGNEGAHQGD
jgi:hypothetical protein